MPTSAPATLCAAAMLASAPAPPACFPCGYDISVIAPPDLPGIGGYVQFVDVNDLGVAVGFAHTLEDLPCVWSEAAGASLLPMPPGVGSARAQAINNNGWILVNGETAIGDLRAFVYVPNGTGWTINPIPWTFGTCWAGGINELNVVVGFHTKASGVGEVGFQWSMKYGLTDIAPSGWMSTRCMDINNDGHICGNVSQEAAADSSVASVRGFHFDGDAFKIIEPPSGYTRSACSRINAFGTVGGIVRKGMGQQTVGGGFIFDPAKEDMVHIPPLPGWKLWALRDLNDAGTAVGVYFTTGGALLPCVACDATVIALLEFFPPGTLVGTDAWAIGATGCIFTQLGDDTLRLCPIGPTADLDCDGVVGPGDLADLLSVWGQRRSEFDLDGSGIVDGGDLGVVLAAWTIN